MIDRDDTNFSTIIENGGHYEWAIQRSDASEYIEKENIVHGTIQSTMFDKLSIGMVVAAQLNLTLWNVEIDPTASLKVLFRATDGTNHSYWHSRGVYYIDKLKASPYSKFVEIVAYDAMLKTETDFAPDGNYVPLTALECAQRIAGDIGVALGPNSRAWMTRNPKTLSNAPHVGVGGTTDRDMLSYIGVLYGANWAIYHDRLEMLFPQYTETDYRAEVGNGVTTLDRGDTEYVTRVRLWLDGQTSFRSPSNLSESEWNALGGRCIEADLPFYATQAAADFILSEYTGRSYVPYNATKVFLDPRHEINDPISFADGNIEFASKIVNQTITMDALAPSDLRFDSEDIVDSYYPYISSVVRNTLYEISQAQAVAGNANAREQTIYKSMPSGTNTVPAYTTWVTNASGDQNTWTTTRPVYDSAYPVLFVATQRQSMDQAGGTVCTCTTPVKDQTTTVIDGGHITTGTIDASVVNVTNINADEINSGTITAIDITGSNITGSTLVSTSSGGSIKIADGEIDFYENATTTGTPFSQLEHVYNSSLNQHAIEWRTTGYTKLINEAGGQWTADFIQFALSAQNPRLMFLIYPDSDGTYARFDTDFVVVNGQLVCKTPSAYGNINFQKTTDTSRGLSVSTVTQTNYNQMYFNEFHRSNDANNSYVDQYWLPQSGTDNSNHTYQIITTKNLTDAKSSVVTSGVVTATTSGITLTAQTCRRIGNLCEITISFYGTISAGGNAEFSVVEGWRSPQDVCGGGFWSQSPLIAKMYANSAVLRVRNASANARTSTVNDPFTVSIIYIQ